MVTIMIYNLHLSTYRASLSKVSLSYWSPPKSAFEPIHFRHCVRQGGALNVWKWFPAIGIINLKKFGTTFEQSS